MTQLLRLLTLSACLLLVACPDGGEDKDGDGFPEELDCNDLNDTVNPGTPELCDGEDNDCDGEIDEDVTEGDTPGYLDADGDGDGFGDSDSEEFFCGELPDGYVLTPGDCDDGDPAVNPDAVEDCTDGIDNDCDGEVDESSDEDGDGVTNCDGDCDDNDPDVYPSNTGAGFQTTSPGPGSWTFCPTD
ncbi:MAG: hypothetical protein GY898_09395 [Proteobacteria bacterium]|nr:hypothetical protein [Pseudomonadota bacterium]